MQRGILNSLEKQDNYKSTLIIRAMKTAHTIDVKLQSYKSFPGHDGARGISAQIVFMGLLIATAYDDARGGEFEYRAIGDIISDGKGGFKNDSKLERNERLLKRLHGECAKLPMITSETVHQGGKPFKYPQDLDTVVEDLANALDLKKDEKKGVLVKSAGGWAIQGWKASIPTMIKNWGKADIVKDLQGMYDECIKSGKEVLNTEYLKELGVTVKS